MTKRSGRFEAWCILALVILGPLLLLGLVLPHLWSMLSWIQAHDASETSDMEDKITAFLILLSAGLCSLMIAAIMCHMVEHALVYFASRTVVSPVHCETIHLSNHPAEVKYTCRFHYQINQQMFHLTHVPESWSPAALSNNLEDRMAEHIYVHPDYPQLARHESLLGSCFLTFQILVCLFANSCLLFMVVWAAYGLQDASVVTWIVGLILCLIGMFVAQRLEQWAIEKGWYSPGKEHVSWNEVQLLWAVLTGRPAPPQPNINTTTNNAQGNDTVTTGYMASDFL